MVPLTQKVIFLLIPDFAVLGHIFTGTATHVHIDAVFTMTQKLFISSMPNMTLHLCEITNFLNYDHNSN